MSIDENKKRGNNGHRRSYSSFKNVWIDRRTLTGKPARLLAESWPQHRFMQTFRQIIQYSRNAGDDQRYAPSVNLVNAQANFLVALFHWRRAKISAKDKNEKHTFSDGNEEMDCIEFVVLNETEIRVRSDCCSHRRHTHTLSQTQCKIKVSMPRIGAKI